MDKLNKADIYSLFGHKLTYKVYKLFFPKKFLENQNLRSKRVGQGQNSLIGFDEKKCIFIHIPKAAGVSLSLGMFDNLGGGHRFITSYYPIYSPQEFKAFYKFTIVRNPWDRLVSAYHFLKEGGFNSVDKSWFEENLSSYENFEEFVNGWVSKENITKFTHFIPQYRYVYDGKKLCVDKVYKFEEMEMVINDINSRLGLHLKNEHKNRTQSRNDDYRSYYSDKTKSIVADVYSKDISLFGYEF